MKDRKSGVRGTVQSRDDSNDPGFVPGPCLRPQVSHKVEGVGMLQCTLRTLDIKLTVPPGGPQLTLEVHPPAQNGAIDFSEADLLLEDRDVHAED